MASKITAQEVKYFIERKLEAMLPPSFKLNTSTSSLVAKQQLGVVRFLSITRAALCESGGIDFIPRSKRRTSMATS
jgi:hypothetical protein